MEKIKRVVSTRSKNFWVFLIYTSLHNIGKSVSAIFIPIILLKLGFSLLEVIFYYILFYSFNVIFNLVSKNLIPKLGVKKSFILATFSLISFFILYLNLEVGNWYILGGMALLMAIYDAFFYISRNYTIIDSSLKKENLKKNNFIYNAVRRVSKFIGPMVGASVIIFTEDKNIILTITSLILVISLIPIFKYEKKEKIRNEKINLKEDLFKHKKRREDYLNIFLFRFSETAEGVLWPIFIFLSFGSLDSVAFLSILVVSVSLAFSYLTVKISQEQKNYFIFWSAVGLIIIWFLRMNFDDDALLYVTSILTGIFGLLINAPISESILTRGKETVPIISAYFRNQIAMIGGLVFYLIIFSVLYSLEIKNSFIIIIITLSMLALINLLLIWRQRK